MFGKLPFPKISSKSQNVRLPTYRRAVMCTIPSRTATVCRLSNCQTHGSVRSVVRPNPRTKKPWTVLVVCNGCTRKRRPNRQTLTRVRCVPITRVPNQPCITIAIPKISIIIIINTTITITIARVRYEDYLPSDLPPPIAGECYF